MKWASLVLFSCCLLAGCNSQNALQKVTENVDINNDSTNMDLESDLNLYLGLVNKEENWVFSPYSIKDCFSIIYPSASGKTKEQIDATLGFSSRSLDFYKDYDSYVKSKNSFGIHVANKGFINEEMKSELNLSVLNTDDLEVLKMDNTTYKHINKYIADNTNNKITDLLSESSVTEDTSLVLVNALHFLKGWDYKEREVWWMPTKSSYEAFGDELDFSNIKEPNKDIDVLRLIYDSKEKNEDGNTLGRDKHKYSMYIICKSTNSQSNVDEFFESLSGKEFSDLLDFSAYKGLKGYDEGSFRIPSFETKNQLSIKDSLKNLGLTECFNEFTTDFKKLGKVYISDVLHGSYVKTDRKGTEAAASTAITMTEMASEESFTKPKKQKSVVANDTFIFVIKDDTANNILFMGRIVEPSEKSN